MSPTPTPWATSVLLIEENDVECTFCAQGLMRCSSDYLIQEATNVQEADISRQSQRIDCVCLNLPCPIDQASRYW